MRPNKGLTLAIVLALPIAGCDDDFLTAVPPDQISDAVFWTQQKDAVLAVNALYPQNFGPDLVVRMEAAGDNGWAQKSFDEWYPVGRGIANSTTGATANFWNTSYSAIRRANEILVNIDRIPQIDAALKERLKAETHFHRAYHYNLLVNLFGDVPLILAPITLAEGRALTRTARAEVVQQILSDLDVAINVLPLSFGGADRGRATRGAALALKARAALYAAGWEQNHGGSQANASALYRTAADAAGAVRDLGVYGLQANYADLTRYAANNSNEIVFADLRVKNGRGHGSFGWLAPRSLQGGSDVTPLRALVDAYQMNDGLPTSQSPLFDPNNPYVNRDPRMYATLLYPGATFGDITYNSLPGSGTPDEVRNDFNATSTGYQFIKYVDLADRNDRGNSGIHFILIRYADVLLMYAEAKLELNELEGTVNDAINQVRTRAGMPAVAAGLSQAELRDLVRYERRVEFAMEGLRIFDIRRWKIAEQVMPGQHLGIDYMEGGQKQTIPADNRVFNPARDYLWPIPNTEIELNSSMTQNPGY